MFSVTTPIKMKSKLTLLLLIFLIPFTISDSFLSRNVEIFRKTGQKGDEFLGPSSLLSSGKCAQLGAETTKTKCDGDSCCQCVRSRATFTFSDGKWNCINDEIIRQQERCGIVFQGEEPGDPFLVKEDGYSLNLTGIESAKASCRLAYNKSRYMDCNGSWVPVKPPASTNAWNIFSPAKLKTNLVLTIKSPGTQFTDGKLMKLWFIGDRCVLTNTSLERCLIFKRPGTMSCRIWRNTSEEASSTLSSSTYDKDSKQDTIYSTAKPRTTGSLPTTYASKVLPKDERTDKVGIVIAGIVSAVAIVALIVIIFFLLRHRRDSKENLSINYNSGTYEVPVDGAESKCLVQGFEGLPHSGQERIGIGSPTYASASCARGPSKVQNLVYDYAKPDGPVTCLAPETAREKESPQGHVYALPERQEKRKAKRDEMAHNYEPLQNRTATKNKNEPCYDVLEGSDPSSPPSPVYNVLEGPNPNSDSDSNKEEEI